ncbi:hypothetical protein D3C86_1071780 [compost metagenome]
MDDLRFRRLQLAFQFHGQPFGRQLDGRERILDLVRQAPRHFAPGHGAVGGNHFGNVVKHHQIAVAAPVHAQMGAARQQGQRLRRGARFALARIDFELLLPMLAFRSHRRMRGKCLSNNVRKFKHTVHRFQRTADHRTQVHPQNGLGALVDGGNAKRLVKHQHPGGQVRQHAFQIDVGPLQLLAIALDHAARFIQLARHGIERARQLAHFVALRGLGQRPVVTHAHRLRAARQAEQGSHQALGQRQRHGDGAERGQEQGQGQGDPVKLAQAQPRQRQFLIIPEPLLHQIGVVRDLLRHRLQQLQPARLGRGTQQVVVAFGSGQRNHHTQVQPAFGPRRDRVIRFGGGIAARQPKLVHDGGRGHGGHQLAVLAGGKRHHAAAAREHHGLLHAVGLAQPGQRQRHAAVRVAVQFDGHGARAGIQIGQQRIQRRAAQVQAGFQRRIHPHVEPRFNGPRHELHRHGVDQGARHHTDQRKRQGKAGGQPRAELPTPDLARQPHRQRHHPDKQRQGEDAVQHQQRVVIARKARGVARGPCQQAQQRQAAYGTHHQGQPEQQPHEGSFSLSLSMNEKSIQGVLWAHELLFKALT